MLLGAGLIDERQLQEALRNQRESGRRLGEELVHLGHISEVQVTQVLSNQLTIPWVSLHHVQFSRDLLNLVPAELAQDFVLIPVYIRKVRREGEVLFVAMDDPTNGELLERLRAVTGLMVKPMVAPPSEIKDAISHQYFGGRKPPKGSFAPMRTEPAPSRESLPVSEMKAPIALGPVVISETLGPVEGAPSAPSDPELPPAAFGEPAGHPPNPAEAPQSQTSPSEDAAPRTEVHVERAAERTVQRPTNGRARNDSEPRPAPRKPALTLTLLDGTTVSLPGPGKRAEEPSSDRLTASAIIADLRARGAGPDSESWEPLVAALLSILIRKGLVADWELLDELDHE